MKRHGFNLVELLVVVVIMGILVMMLMPAGRAAWDSALAARCRANLETIWKAQAVWRADNNTDTFTRGPGWHAMLYDYVEDVRETFICPAHPGGMPPMGTAGAGGSGASGGSDGREGMRPNESREVIPEALEFKFVIYAKDNATPGVTPLSAYPLTIPLTDQSIFAICVEKTNQYERWHCDDGEHKTVSGSKGGDDIQFTIMMKDGHPTELRLEPGSSSSRNEYRYEFWVNDSCFISNWLPLALARATINLWEPDGSSTFDPGTGGSQYFEDLNYDWAEGAGYCDYGLSVGTYQVLGTRVPRVDGKQFLILDYPMSVATYYGVPSSDDPWDKYFIRDEDAWMEQYGAQLEEEATGITWEYYQALRHFDRANVLFCDGHIESLPWNELEQTDPRWYFRDY